MILTLIDKVLEAKDSKSFVFQTEKNLKYLPGQYMYITLPELKFNDTKGPTRYFTISSSPTESPFIKITTRIRKKSGFKKTLDQLKIGEKISAEGPSGTYILDESEKGNHILIAGGIGITPFRSFIKYHIDKNILETNFYLIYSNSYPDDIVFKKELDDWSDNFSNINVVHTITNTKAKKIPGSLNGRIDKNVIKKLISKWKLNNADPTFWVCGPPSMVDAIEKSLIILNTAPEKLRSEKFSGY